MWSVNTGNWILYYNVDFDCFNWSWWRGRKGSWKSFINIYIYIKHITYTIMYYIYIYIHMAHMTIVTTSRWRPRPWVETKIKYKPAPVEPPKICPGHGRIDVWFDRSSLIFRCRVAQPPPLYSRLKTLSFDNGRQ